MSKKKPDPFQDAVRILLEADAPRVWSLIVTVFGDLAQDKESAISGPLLADILTPLGIKPEAMRVALHRLRNEGWIETSKRGREALHRLSQQGLRESRAASERIYSPSFQSQGAWHMICLPPISTAQEQTRACDLRKQGYVPVAQGAYLAHGTGTAPPKDALVITGDLSAVPDWVGKALVPPSLISAFKDLSAALALVDWKSPELANRDALEIAVLRTLVVHRWRKLILRLPAAPDAVFGKDFAGFTCRALVMEALAALPRPDLSALNAK